MGSNGPWPPTALFFTFAGLLLFASYLFPFFVRYRHSRIAVTAIWWLWGMIIPGVIGEVNETHVGWPVGIFLLGPALAATGASWVWRWQNYYPKPDGTDKK